MHNRLYILPYKKFNKLIYITLIKIEKQVYIVNENIFLFFDAKISFKSCFCMFLYQEIIKTHKNLTL